MFKQALFIRCLPNPRNEKQFMNIIIISNSKILNCESFQDQFSQRVRDRLNFYTSVTILECSMYFVDCCLWVSVTGPCAATRLQKIRQIV